MSLIRKQKSTYTLDDNEKSDLTDIILAAINEITKCDISKESRYDVGVDITNMPPFNPYNVSETIQELGYEEDEDGFDTNGWQNDYWNTFHHPDKTVFPDIQISGTSFIHTCHINGIDEDDTVYTPLEDNSVYAKRIKHGYELLNDSQFNRPEK